MYSFLYENYSKVPSSFILIGFPFFKSFRRIDALEDITLRVFIVDGGLVLPLDDEEFNASFVLFSLSFFS